MAKGISNMANKNAGKNGIQTRFKKGQKANPNGRKKGPDLGAMIQAQAVEIIEDEHGEKRERLVCDGGRLKSCPGAI